VAGAVVAGDLAASLQAKGFAVTRLVAYEAEAARALSTPAQHALTAGMLDAALFYSPRTARIFATLVRAGGLAPSLAAVTAGCLSEAVSDALHSLPWQRIVVANAPTEDALLAATGVETSPDATEDVTE